MIKPRGKYVTKNTIRNAIARSYTEKYNREAYERMKIAFNCKTYDELDKVISYYAAKFGAKTTSYVVLEKMFQRREIIE